MSSNTQAPLCNNHSWFCKLIELLGQGRFFEEYWSRQPAYLPPQKTILELLTTELGELSFSTLAENARGGSQAWVSSPSFGHIAIPVSPESASAAFNTGATLYFVDLPCQSLVTACSNALGIAVERIRVNVFVTPVGGGAPLHFDANENFTIQLQGAKTWFLAPNQCVDAPLDNYVLGSNPTKGLDLLLKSALPNRPVEPAFEISLTAGAVLYVPRGYWHWTRALTESWSINLCCGCTTYGDLLIQALRSLLEQFPEWRASAIGYTPNACEIARRAFTPPLSIPSALATSLTSLNTLSVLMAQPKISNQAQW
jgi:50S ribosomal protein L16 3-hydroxylase